MITLRKKTFSLIVKDVTEFLIFLRFEFKGIPSSCPSMPA